MAPKPPPFMPPAALDVQRVGTCLATVASGRGVAGFLLQALMDVLSELRFVVPQGHGQLRVPTRVVTLWLNGDPVRVWAALVSDVLPMNVSLSASTPLAVEVGDAA